MRYVNSDNIWELHGAPDSYRSVCCLGVLEVRAHFDAPWMTRPDELSQTLLSGFHHSDDETHFESVRRREMAERSLLSTQELIR